MSPTTTAFSSPSQSPNPGITKNRPNGSVAIEDVTGTVPGWPALARTIANKPAFVAFPSFNDLNVKSLLYYQAELIKLRKELHETEYQDYFHGDASQIHFAEDLDWLFDSVQSDSEQKDSDQKDSEQSPEQLRILEKIRIILDKYNAALIQFSRVSEFPEADSSNVECLRNCAREVVNGSAITGSGSQTWGTLCKAKVTQKSLGKLVWGLFVGLFKTQEVKRAKVPKEFQEHLIVPRAGSKPDGLTLWVVYSFIPLFHRVWRGCGEPTWAKLWGGVKGPFSSCHLPRFRQDSSASTASTAGTAASSGSNLSKAGDKNLTAYSKSWILRVTSILTTIVACLLPVVAIVVLSRVQSMGMILGLIAIFNSVFAFGLVLISSGSSRVEIFTATAAFSAVMVVFVQNKISQN
jgi:hypothetical protein